MSPAAVIPWVAACYATKALRQSAPEPHDAQANFTYVVSRMEWYDSLQTLAIGNGENDSTHREFQKRIKDLYATILLYLMKVSLLRFRGFSYGYQVPISTEELSLDSVTKAERALAGFNEEQVSYELRRLFEAAVVQAEAPNELLDALRVMDPKSHLATSDVMQENTTNEIYCAVQRRDDGGHGQGKIKLLHGIIQDLYKRTDSPDVAFFFFSYTSYESNNAAAALRNLIYLIITRCSSLAQHLKNKLDTTGRKQFDHPNDFLALSALFFDMIQDEEFPKMYLIVDSLDECKHHRTEFTNLIIESALVCSPIKWLVSGISDQEGSHSKHLALASDIHDSCTAMDNYIKDSVSVLARDNSFDDELEKIVTDRLCELNIKNYLWVDIVCGMLKSKVPWRVEEFVAEVGTKRDLSDLFSLQHEIVDKKEEHNYCIDVLLVMGAIYESLSIDELKKLMGWSPRVDMKTILYHFSGFIHLQGDTVSFRHESAREYTKHNILDPAKRSKIHVELTVRCLESLGHSLGNEYTARPGGTRDQQGMACTIAGSYASLYWMQHLVQVTDAAENSEVRDSVISFLKKRFLHWVDVLTLGDKIHLVVSRLRDADMHLRKMKRNNSELADNIRDAHLFLRKHPKIDKTWSPNYTTFRGHMSEVRSIAISSDGRVLASGSDDGTVRIWDTETGTTQHVFEVKDGTYTYVTQVALAARIIAAAPDDLPVILWDALTGRKVGELPAYTTAADALCLSPDGRKIAVAARMKVYVWNIEELLGGSEPKGPVRYPIRARGLVFSRDNELFVTSKDAIQLCGSNSFQVRQRFTNDEMDFTCAALSPCKISGTRLLASGSEDGRICIWEMDADIKYGANAPTPAIKPLHIRKIGGSKDEDAPASI
ncbi:hypothetical protein F5Y08DRAFT_343415 [Xylaria arbuscula]|nr:hypothetical protein F5Y08DRAFT_343415 [Xylaria arbuscula]